MRSHRESGFTLIEFLLATAIAAVVLAMALPDIRQSMRANRVAVSTNEFIAALSLARNRSFGSLHEGQVCASADGKHCSGSWNDGWIVWFDRNQDHEPSTDEILRRASAQDRIDLRATGAPAAAAAMTFDRRGRLSDGRQRDFALTYASCASGENDARRITVASNGQVRVKPAACE
ncbi:MULTISPECIES: GspH/FimT family pseudopilin [Lysobacter]|jgi:type IV fimbrial biogenesis protein FimT|uniref:GspH/FimT family pseudopilin n=1 Tax=Lysobacter TaxID=68 RepID=UPI001F301A64|nr:MULTISPECIES: GspH/FimT family pseudopilin [Lysobacter]UJB20576.1 GspH/FimT family pseudopilin [Lysobacter capsici]UJQ30310.1 GspH/FimT family pseudopilin [Lysobacter gummosus]